MEALPKSNKRADTEGKQHTGPFSFDEEIQRSHRRDTETGNPLRQRDTETLEMGIDEELGEYDDHTGDETVGIAEE